MRGGAWPPLALLLLLLCAAAALASTVSTSALSAAAVDAEASAVARDQHLTAAAARAQERRRRRLHESDGNGHGRGHVLALPGPAFSDVQLQPPNGCGTGADASSHSWETSGLPVCGRVLHACEHMPWAAAAPATAPDAFASAEPMAHTTRTAARVWDGAIALARYFDAAADDATHPLHRWLRGRRALELGSGQSGLAGLAAAACGAAHVALTDMPEALPALHFNAQLNFGAAHVHGRGVVSVAGLDWRSCGGDGIACSTECIAALSALPAVDAVVSADVVWVEALIRPLVRTAFCALFLARARARDASQPPAGPVWVMAHQSRSRRADELLRAELHAFGFTARTLHSGAFGSAVDVLAISWADTSPQTQTETVRPPRGVASAAADRNTAAALPFPADDSFASVMARVRSSWINDLWGGYWWNALLRVALVSLIVFYVRVNMRA